MGNAYSTEQQKVFVLKYNVLVVICMKYTRVLKNARLIAELSQRELGKKVYLDAKTISNYENDKTRPSIDTIFSILESCGFKVILYKDDKEYTLDDMLKDYE